MHTELNLLAMPVNDGPRPIVVDTGADGLHLRLTNHERPLIWKLGFQPPRHKAQLSSALAAVVLKEEVPAEHQTSKPPMGEALSSGMAELGLQTSDECEYFLSKGTGLVGILRLRRKGDGWSATISKDYLPRVVSTEAVEMGLMPPLGKSALPTSLQRVVPPELQYWNATTPDEARAARDALVDAGFFSPDCIKVVDGELCKVEQRFFLYEPEKREETEPKLATAPTLGDKLVDQLASQVVKGDELVAVNELTEVSKVDAEGRTLVVSPMTADLPSLVSALEGVSKAAWVVETDDTTEARQALAKLAPVFKLDGSGSLFATSFPLAMPGKVTWLSKGGASHTEVHMAVSAALKEVHPPTEVKEGDYTYKRSEFWTVDMYDDAVIVELRKDGKLYRHPYSYEGGEVTLGEMEQVTRTYVNASELRTVHEMRMKKGQPVQKPFAGFDDFDACLAAQSANGKDEEAARRICGALQHQTEKRQELNVKVAKVGREGDERYILGIVLEPEPFEGEGDAQNDTYSADEIRVAAHKFMSDFRNMGEMHKKLVNKGVRILESFLAPVDFELEGVTVKKGSWLLGSRVISDELWDKVKAGTYAGYSIGGSAIRTAEG